MRCPKCGAFLEEGKTICMMCGTNAQTYTSNGSDGFSNGFGNQVLSNDYIQQKEAYNNRMNDYKKINYNEVKKGEKDIFDIYSEYKTIINCALTIIFVGLAAFICFKIYKGKTSPTELEPKYENLYYEVDDYFTNISSNDQIIYTKSGSKGTDCSISIGVGSDTNSNHVEDYYAEVKRILNNGNNIDNPDLLKELVTQQSIRTIEGNEWHYMNVFYRVSQTSDFTHLRYIYLSTLYKGFFYDIELANHNNDLVCSALQDDFVSSLQFIN